MDIGIPGGALSTTSIRLPLIFATTVSCCIYTPTAIHSMFLMPVNLTRGYRHDSWSMRAYHQNMIWSISWATDVPLSINVPEFELSNKALEMDVSECPLTIWSSSYKYSASLCMSEDTVNCVGSCPLLPLQGQVRTNSMFALRRRWEFSVCIPVIGCTVGIHLLSQPERARELHFVMPKPQIQFESSLRGGGSAWFTRIF